MIMSVARFGGTLSSFHVFQHSLRRLYANEGDRFSVVASGHGLRAEDRVLQSRATDQSCPRRTYHTTRVHAVSMLRVLLVPLFESTEVDPPWRQT